MAQRCGNNVLQPGPRLDGALVVDQDARILTWGADAETCFGRPAQDALHRPLHSLFLQPGLVRHALRQARAEGRAACRVKLARDRRTRSVLLKLQASEGGAMVVSVRDAPAPRDAAPAPLVPVSATIQEDLGPLMASLSHEIGTPLTSLTTHLFLLQRHLPQDGSGARRSDVMASHAGAMEGAERLDRLVRSLRRASRSYRYQREDAPLHEVVRSTIGAFEPRLPPRHRIEPDLVPVGSTDVHAASVQEALTHLLANAVEAMPQGGTVRVRLRPSEGGALLEICDSGTGIPPEVAARMYGPYFSTKVGHVGLGLTLARCVLHSHGGSLRHASAPEGGAVALVWLPLSKPAEDASTVES